MNLNNNYRKNISQSLSKKIIKIYAVDVYSSFDIKKFTNYNNLSEKFIFEIDSRNPDYLLYSTCGHNHLKPKYNKCIKISFFAENRIVDFEKADYCFGNHHIIYLDRYFRYPLFIRLLKVIRSNNNKTLSEIRENSLLNHNKKKFCAAVISNYFFTDYFRLDFIKKLNLYKKVDMGGKFHNNVGGPTKNKIKFLSEYKFSIAMENTNGDGYISEKIIESFYSGSIPIYYGNYMLDEF